MVCFMRNDFCFYLCQLARFAPATKQIAHHPHQQVIPPPRPATRTPPTFHHRPATRNVILNASPPDHAPKLRKATLTAQSAHW
jgi:hypothetical protein